MGAVFRDKRSRKPVWSIRYKDVDGRLRWERTPARSKVQARQVLHEREKAVIKARGEGFESVEPLITPQPVMSLRKYAAKFMEYCLANCETSTVKRYKYFVKNHILPALGKLTLQRVKPGEIQDYSNQRLLAGAAPASVRQELMWVSGLYREAMKDELVARNPVKLVKKPTVHNLIVRYLDETEEWRLLGFTPEPLRSAIIVAIHSGLRDGEQKKLAWPDVKYKENHIIVRKPKNKKDRVVPMSRTLRKTLKAIPRHESSPYVFTNPDTGKPYDHFGNTLWKKVRDLAEIKNFRWHDLRHTFGSRLAQAGVPILTIKGPDGPLKHRGDHAVRPPVSEQSSGCGAVLGPRSGVRGP